MFDPGAFCFGSYAARCEGIDALVRRQWRKIWPNITGFAFDRRASRVCGSVDGRWLCGMVPWRSVGYDAEGRPFRRQGRLTIVLARRTDRAPWRAVHTHYSLNPGTPQTRIRRAGRRLARPRLSRPSRSLRPARRG
jgi:hypothetical protein